jgi:hypothetical protein
LPVHARKRRKSALVKRADANVLHLTIAAVQASKQLRDA